MQYNRQELNEIIAREFDVDVAALQPEANIRKTLQLDSLSAMELVVLIKRTTGVLIPTMEMPKITTFEKMYIYIENRL